MKKSIKGAVAGGGAAVLLLGGAGTLTYWYDSGDVTGGSLDSGHLSLENDICDAWSLTDAEGTQTFDPLTDHMVPGDVLERTCHFDIVATGDHLEANLAIGVPSASNSNALTGVLVLDADFTVGGVVVTTISEANDGDTLDAVETVTFPYGVAIDNTTQDLTAVIADIAVTATQVHS